VDFLATGARFFAAALFAVLDLTDVFGEVDVLFVGRRKRVLATTGAAVR
jgi:hypothetical protein